MEDEQKVVFSEKTSDKKWYRVSMMIRGPIYAKEIDGRYEAAKMEDVSEKADRVIAAIDKGIGMEFGQYDRRDTTIVLVGDDKQRELHEKHLVDIEVQDLEKKPDPMKTEPREPSQDDES